MSPVSPIVAAMTPNITRAIYFILGLLIVVAASFFSGASWKEVSLAKRAAQEETSRAIQHQIDVNLAVIEANKDSQVIIDALNDRAKNDASAKQAVIVHLDNKRKSAERKLNELEAAGVGKLAISQVCSDADLYRLDRFTLRMLNNSGVTGNTADPGARADEEGRTLTGVGGQDIVDHAMTVRGMYGRLATKCDRLIDKVKEYQDKQASR